MTTPTCPVHLTAMEPSKFGGFYCKKKDANGFCKEKAAGPAAPRSENPSSPAAVLAASNWVPAHAGSDTRVAAALNFAGQIYQGSGSSPDTNTAELEKLALQLAERALLMFERKP